MQSVIDGGHRHRKSVPFANSPFVELTVERDVSPRIRRCRRILQRSPRGSACTRRKRVAARMLSRNDGPLCACNELYIAGD